MLSKIRDALLTVTQKTYHYEPPDDVTGNYIVWAEDGEGGSVRADNELQEQVITGTIDYFTKTEYDSNYSSIQTALNTAEISFRLNSIQREKETGYIHYEWVWELG